MTNRAYKLQEFVAHSSNVNCLAIGKKSSRVLVTGGEDQKVNMWAIGKPNAILSLSGHTSAVESVTFDAAEVLVVAGAASGTIKLWDLEEAKIVRTLTGHRSNCVSLSFHPFGEFFASGSLDTNLKIWDIRRKGCIHTYKGHSRGIRAIKFSPDGKWVVSGGEDNSVKLWDLTAGKLMHDFKYHEGQIQCLDFHPQEFLLATGSADRTVKFWDLETFELIGSTGPEATGVRAMTFNPDGRTLLCAMHDSFKVLSWEPVRCHDVVDVGWSKLADLSVHEGKLIGCSFQQSCVGVWVVDLMRVSPFQVGHGLRGGNPGIGKGNINGHQVNQHSALGNPKSNGIRSCIPDLLESTLSTSMKEMTLATTKMSENLQSLSSRTSAPVSSKIHNTAPSPTLPVQTPRRSARVHAGNLVRSSSRSDVLPTSSHISSVEMDRHIQSPSPALEDSSLARPSSGLAALSGRSDLRNVEALRGDAAADAMRIDIGSSANVTSSSHRSFANGDKGSHEPSLQSASHRDADDGNDSSWNDMRKLKRSSSFGVHRSDGLHKSHGHSLSLGSEAVQPQTSRPATSAEASTTGWRMDPCQNFGYELQDMQPGTLHGRGLPSRTQGLIAQWDRKERADAAQTPRQAANGAVKPLGLDFSSFAPRGSHVSMETSGSASLCDEELIEKLMQQHHTMASIMQARLTNMQVVRRFWMKNDVRGAMEAMAKLADHSVLVDVLNVVMERSSVLSLEVSGLLLPLLNELLCSHNERHVLIAITLVQKLVKTFGQTIHAAISASPSLGVDLQAEQRLERCKVCHEELQQVSRSLTPLLRKGGEVSKAAQELSGALKEILDS